MCKHLAKLLLALLVCQARGGWILELVELCYGILNVAEQHICHIASHSVAHNYAHNYHIFNGLRHSVCRHHLATLLQCCLQVVEGPLGCFVVLRVHIPDKERVVDTL